MFSRSKIELTYVANSGVSIQYKDKKIMIDGVHMAQSHPYYSTPQKFAEKMLLNKEPFNNIDLMFFTHHHTDHFDPQMTNEILKRNKHIQLVGTSSVLDMLSACDNYNPILASQVRPVSLPRYKSIQMNVKETPFEVISVVHDSDVYQGVENFAFLFEIKNRIFLHVGDAQASVYNFQSGKLFEKHVDVLMVPFPFIGLSAGRKIIHNINPQRVVVTHLPDKKYDTMNWLYNTYKVYKKYQNELPQVDFLTKPGQSVIL